MDYKKELSERNLPLNEKIYRAFWRFVWLTLASWTPNKLHVWRIFLLKIFGAKVKYTCSIYPSVTIWSPKNLVMKKYSALAPGVDCYNVAKVTIGSFATVSQRTYICTASHDYNQAEVNNNLMPLVAAEINIKDFAWIAAECFIAPGVTIGQGSIAVARSVVTRNLDSSCVYGGNPARKISNRNTIFKD